MDEPYAAHARALRHIVDKCGGPDIVKVVLSSNWRTMDERVRWLKWQLLEYGIDMVGHTDMVKVHPNLNSYTDKYLERDLEIFRALHFRSLGQGGPCLDSQTGNMTFSAWALPANWDIKAWIAIDDLPLHMVPASRLDGISLFSSVIKFSEDMAFKEVPGWIVPPDGFLQTMQDWLLEFEAQHFVEVSMNKGIAGTPGAVEKAIELLNDRSEL